MDYDHVIEGEPGAGGTWIHFSEDPDGMVRWTTYGDTDKHAAEIERVIAKAEARST